MPAPLHSSKDTYQLAEAAPQSADAELHTNVSALEGSCTCAWPSEIHSTRLEYTLGLLTSAAAAQASAATKKHTN